MTTTGPAPNRDIVLYLEVLLERARRGEVQILIASSAHLPMTLEGWGSLEVEGYAAFGPLVPRLDKESLKGAYAKTLEGLQGAAREANEAFDVLVARFVPGEGEAAGCGAYDRSPSPDEVDARDPARRMR